MPRPTRTPRIVPVPTVHFEPLEVDGITYRLAFDYNAIAEAEQAAGINLLEGMGKVLLGAMTAGHLRALLYAALLKAHPGITLDQAGDLLGIHNSVDVRDALLRAWNASCPPEKKFLGVVEGNPAPGVAPAET